MSSGANGIKFVQDGIGPKAKHLPRLWRGESRWFLRQIRGRAITLWLLSLFLFALFRVLPGNAQQISALNQPGGVIQPRASASATQSALVVNYLEWISHLARLDFGTSIRLDLPVSSVLLDHLAVSLALGTSALALFYLVAVPLGLLSAWKHERITGKMLDHLFDIMFSLPSFWISLLLLMLLCGGDYLSLFPVTGMSSADGVQRGMTAALLDRLWHMVLPVACLSYAGIAYVARQVRSATMECLGSEFLLAARARGLRPSEIMRRHVLPHALLPVVALMGQFFPALFAGSVVVETVFTLPGMGRLTLDSVLARDFPVLLAIGILSAVVSLAGGLLVEWIMRHWHPRWEGE